MSSGASIPTYFYFCPVLHQDDAGRLPARVRFYSKKILTKGLAKPKLGAGDEKVTEYIVNNGEPIRWETVSDAWRVVVDYGCPKCHPECFIKPEKKTRDCGSCDEEGSCDRCRTCDDEGSCTTGDGAGADVAVVETKEAGGETTPEQHATIMEKLRVVLFGMAPSPAPVTGTTEAETGVPLVAPAVPTPSFKAEGAEGAISTSYARSPVHCSCASNVNMLELNDVYTHVVVFEGSAKYYIFFSQFAKLYPDAAVVPCPTSIRIKKGSTALTSVNRRKWGVDVPCMRTLLFGAKPALYVPAKWTFTVGLKNACKFFINVARLDCVVLLPGAHGHLITNAVLISVNNDPIYVVPYAGPTC